MKNIEVEITGETPLLMNSPLRMLEGVDNSLKPTKSRRATELPSPNEDAEKSAYWLKKPITKKLKKELYIPSEAVFRSMINASSFYKIAKKSAKTVLAGCVRIEPLEIPLGTDKYEVDARTVVIQRARVVRGRARLDTWKASFNIKYDDRMIGDPQIIYNVLEESGLRIGLLDFRPQRGGSFGCFRISKWLPQKKK